MAVATYFSEVSVSFNQAGIMLAMKTKPRYGSFRTLRTRSDVEQALDFLREAYWYALSAFLQS